MSEKKVQVSESFQRGQHTGIVIMAVLTVAVHTVFDSEKVTTGAIAFGVLMSYLGAWFAVSNYRAELRAQRLVETEGERLQRIQTLITELDERLRRGGGA